MARKEGKSKAGIVILVLLLLLAGAAGFLYYTIVKAPLALDDPQAMAASAPMKAEERFCFDASSGTAQVKMDASDLWHLILAHAGKDFLEIVNEELSGYGVRLNGCAIHIDENGLRLDGELTFRDTRLVVKVPCDLEISGQQLCLSPAGVKLGVIPLPVKGLLSNVKLEYGLALPVLSEVTEVAFAEGAVLLTGPVEEDIRSLAPQAEKLYRYAVFSGEWRLLADTLGTEGGFAQLLTRLERSPGAVEELYRELFVQADAKNTEAYLEARFGLTQRFLPGVDFGAVEEARTALNDRLDPMARSLEQFFTAVVGDYNDKKFRLSGGEFLKYGKPFRADSYGGGKYQELFQLLDPESFFLVLVDAEDGFIRNTSSFYRICDEKQEFTQTVDFNKTYILGCVIKNAEGEPYLMYEAEIQSGNTYSRNIQFLPLTEEEAAALQQEGKFGVWTGKE